ncbi:MAG: hypothetical protein ABIP71_00710, partial [Verrucomicrobiota bacterium]
MKSETPVTFIQSSSVTLKIFREKKVGGISSPCAPPLTSAVILVDFVVGAAYKFFQSHREIEIVRQDFVLGQNGHDYQLSRLITK